MNIIIEHLSLLELKEFLREQSLDTFPDLKDEPLLNMLAEKWYAHAEFCTCREETGLLVGMVAFYANRPETQLAFTPHAYVSKNYRRKSLFTEMLNLVKRYIASKGFSSIRLEVKVDNHDALKTFKKNGFYVINCGNINNKKLVMQLEL